MCLRSSVNFNTTYDFQVLEDELCLVNSGPLPDHATKYCTQLNALKIKS
jgi:hypothetical protein